MTLTDNIFNFLENKDYEKLEKVLNSKDYELNKDSLCSSMGLVIKCVKTDDTRIVKLFHEKGIIKSSEEINNCLHVFCNISDDNIDMLNFFISLYKLDKPFCEKKLKMDYEKNEREIFLRIYPLVDSIRMGHIKKMKRLMDVSYVNGDKNTALVNAVIYGNEKAIDLLFDKLDIEEAREEISFILNDHTQMNGIKSKVKNSYNYFLYKVSALNDKKHLKENIEPKTNKNKKRMI